MDRLQGTKHPANRFVDVGLVAEAGFALDQQGVGNRRFQVARPDGEVDAPVFGFAAAGDCRSAAGFDGVVDQIFKFTRARLGQLGEKLIGDRADRPRREAFRGLMKPIPRR